MDRRRRCRERSASPARRPTRCCSSPIRFRNRCRLVRPRRRPGREALRLPVQPAGGLRPAAVRTGQGAPAGRAVAPCHRRRTAESASWARTTPNAIVARTSQPPPPSPEWSCTACPRAADHERAHRHRRLPAGRYAIKVAGYNGATSASPYTLRVRTTPSEGAAACAAPPVPPATLVSQPRSDRDRRHDNDLVDPPRPAAAVFPTAPARRGTPWQPSWTRSTNAPAEFADTSAAIVTLDDLALRRVGCRTVRPRRGQRGRVPDRGARSTRSAPSTPT